MFFRSDRGLDLLPLTGERLSGERAERRGTAREPPGGPSMAECALPAFGLDILPTSSASVLISLRAVNGSRPGRCSRLSSQSFDLLMHRRAEGRWQGLVSGLLPREVPGVRCTDVYGCIFRACSIAYDSKNAFEHKGTADPHCTQPSAVVRTPPSVLPSPQPHLAARLELFVSPPLNPPLPINGREWTAQLNDRLNLVDFRLVLVEVSSTGTN
eukprot:scaffold191626_cov34-Tisochrysis_lutea.AAC.1